MSPLIGRILTILLGVGVAGGFGAGAGQLARQFDELSASYGVGSMLIVGLMMLLALISIVRMPLSHHAVRRHRR